MSSPNGTDAYAVLSEAESLLHLHGRHREAIHKFSQAANLARQNSDMRTWVLCNCRLASVLSFLGDDTAAETHLRDTAEIASSSDDATAKCQAFNKLADILVLQNRNDEAEQWLNKAVEFAQQQEDARVKFETFRSFAKYLFARGADDQAKLWHNKSATIAKNLQRPLERWHACQCLGGDCQDRCEYPEAKEWMQLAVGAAHEGEHPVAISHSCRSLGELFSLVGEDPEPLFRTAVEAAKEVEDSLVRCIALTELGELLVKRKEFDEGEAFLVEAVEFAESLDAPRPRCRAYVGYAQALAEQGKYLDAESWLRKAVEEAARQEDAVARCMVSWHLGKVLLALDKRSEAKTWLQFAANEATHVNEPFALCNAEIGLGIYHFVLENWTQSIEHYSSACNHLLRAIRENVRATGIARLMEDHTFIFRKGFDACVNAWRLDGNNAAVLRTIEFVDGSKCVAIRQSLQQYASSRASSPTRQWRPGPRSLASLFPSTDASYTPAAEVMRRGVHSSRIGDPTKNIILEYPGTIDAGKNAVCKAVTESELLQILPDQNTVILNFYFAGDDLVVMPVGLDEERNVEFYTPSDGFACSRGALRRIKKLVWRQSKALRYASRCSPQQIHEDRRVDLRSIYQELYSEMGFDGILTAIQREYRTAYHVIAVPDGPLYSLPIHAACDSAGRYAYEKVDSFRYGLSLRTLVLQQEIENRRAPAEKRSPRLRGTVFANPDWRLRLVNPEQLTIYDQSCEVSVDDETFGLSDRQFSLMVRLKANAKRWTSGFEVLDLRRPGDASLDNVVADLPEAVRSMIQIQADLPGIGEEVSSLIEETDADSWRIHGQAKNTTWRALKQNYHQWHGSGNVLWCAGHGGKMTCEISSDNDKPVLVTQPSLLLADGPLGLSHLLQSGHDYRRVRLAHFSCCLLGELDQIGYSSELLGFGAVLTLLGCRRVSSSLWMLSDSAATLFGRGWIREIDSRAFGRSPTPHSFAIAFKSALENTRKQNDRMFDHEYFWAPFTLYGLG